MDFDAPLLKLEKIIFLFAHTVKPELYLNLIPMTSFVGLLLNRKNNITHRYFGLPLFFPEDRQVNGFLCLVVVTY